MEGNKEGFQVMERRSTKVANKWGTMERKTTGGKGTEMATGEGNEEREQRLAEVPLHF